MVAGAFMPRTASSARMVVAERQLKLVRRPARVLSRSAEAVAERVRPAAFPHDAMG